MPKQAILALELPDLTDDNSIIWKHLEVTSPSPLLRVGNNMTET
jgi:N6-adenosine-specific RNA methylase IME4